MRLRASLPYLFFFIDQLCKLTIPTAGFTQRSFWFGLGVILITFLVLLILKQQINQVREIWWAALFTAWGTVSNGIDMVRIGAIVDYIPVRFNGEVLFNTNIADIMIWFGIVSCFYYLQKKVPTST